MGYCLSVLLFTKKKKAAAAAATAKKRGVTHTYAVHLYKHTHIVDTIIWEYYWSLKYWVESECKSDSREGEDDDDDSDDGDRDEETVE